MVDQYQFTSPRGEKFAFAREVRCRGPPEIRVEGVRTSNYFANAQVAGTFVEQPDSYLFKLRAEPYLKKPIDELSYDEARAAAAVAGQMRHVDVPRFLDLFTRSLGKVFVLPGKRPFYHRRKAKPGRVIPDTYYPYGPWKLHLERSPFDLATSAELDVKKRHTHPRPLCDLVEELINTRISFSDRSTTVTVFYTAQTTSASFLE